MEGKNILQNHEIVSKRLKKISNNMYQLYKVLKAKNMIDRFFLGISHESLFFRNCNDNMPEKATGIIQPVDERYEVFQIGFSEYHKDEVVTPLDTWFSLNKYCFSGWINYCEKCQKVIEFFPHLLEFSPRFVLDINEYVKYKKLYKNDIY